MENSYRYFENRDCCYYPCHEELEELNCLFCFCPLYAGEHCPGKPEYIISKGQTIKSCRHCTFPHKAENYETLIQFLKRGSAETKMVSIPVEKKL